MIQPSATNSERVIRLHRVFKASADRVFGAWTRPELCKILLGTLQYFIVSLAAVFLLRFMLVVEAPFFKRFVAVFLAGLMGTLFIRLGDPIWFHLPWPHALGHAMYEVSAWGLLGLVLGVINPSRPKLA